jgi:hypothetical protein
VQARQHGRANSYGLSSLPTLPDAADLPSARSTRQIYKASRQRVCREGLSAKTSRQIFCRQRRLCREPFLGRSANYLPRANGALGKEKDTCRLCGRYGTFAENLTRHSANRRTFAESLLSAKHGPLCRVPALGKEWASLPRARPCSR